MNCLFNDLNIRTSCSMLQKLPKFLKVAQKTGSCSKVAKQRADRATAHPVGARFTDIRDSLS